MVVLGLVTTKTKGLESHEQVSGRINEASRIIPLSRLALSPQCGFSTSIEGNNLTIEDEKRKLKLIVETARIVWG